MFLDVSATRTLGRLGLAVQSAVGEEHRKGLYREAPKLLILRLDICVFVLYQNDMISAQLGLVRLRRFFRELPSSAT